MSVAPESIARFLEDASGYRGEAEQAFAPETLDDVREIVQRASTNGIPLTIAGAGTGLTGASVPHGGWVLSLERFHKIEIGNGVARCGGGAYLRICRRRLKPGGSFSGRIP